MRIVSARPADYCSDHSKRHLIVNQGKRTKRVAALSILAALGLGGCSGSSNLDALLGPGVRLEAAQVAESTDNFSGVRNSLLQRAGLSQPPALGSKDWLLFISAGYSFVDEKCNAFINALYWHDRKRKTLSRQTLLFADASRTILSELNAATKALNIVATSFSLATYSIDNLYGSVLFSMPPATIQTMMVRLRRAHREVVTRNPDPHLGQPQAMTVLADYLSICLPANIEARIQNTLNETLFLANADGSVSGTSIRSSANQRALERELKLRDEARKLDEGRKIKRGQVFKSAETTFQRPPKPPANTRFVKNTRPEEGRPPMKIDIGHQIQENLCVAKDGDFGRTDQSATRQGIMLFKRFHERDPKKKHNGTINTDKLEIDIRKSGKCDRAKYRNVYEKLVWTSPGRSPAQFNKTLAKALIALRAGGSLSTEQVDNDWLLSLASDDAIGANTTRVGLALIAKTNKTKIINQSLMPDLHAHILKNKSTYDAAPDNLAVEGFKLSPKLFEKLKT